MRPQQILLGLVLTLALLSCVCALIPKHVFRPPVLGKIGSEFELKKWPETSFDFAKPEIANHFRKIFKEVVSQPDFLKMYPCENPQSADLVSFRATMRQGVWTRVVYRVSIELPKDLEDMIFVEIFTILGASDKSLLMAISNRKSSADPLPDQIEHFINGCPAPFRPTLTR